MPGIGHLIVNEAVLDKLYFSGRESQEHYHNRKCHNSSYKNTEEGYGGERLFHLAIGHRRLLRGDDAFAEIWRLKLIHPAE